MGSVNVRGLDDALAKLTALGTALPAEAGKAMRAEAEIEMTEAKKRTPWKTGALRASGHVTGPTQVGRNIEVKMLFGGPAVDYALAVHENLEAIHPHGQAKFLESVLLESRKYLADRIAARMKARMK